MVRAALLGVLAGCAAAADDASALVQAQVHRHGHDALATSASMRDSALGFTFSETSNSFNQHVAQTFQQLAQHHVPEGYQAPPGAANLVAERRAATATRSLVRQPGGIFVERWIEAAPGNSMQLNISTGCELEDEFGQNNCTLYWGDNVTISQSYHLDKGISPGDKVVMAFNLTAEALNKSQDISKLFGGVPAGAQSSCDVCSGSCTGTLTAGGLLVEMTRPTVLNGVEWCGSGENAVSKITDVNVSSLTFAMPAGFPAAWQMTGEATVSSEITQNGTVTLASTVKQTIIEGSPSSAAMRAVTGPATASSFLEVIDQVYRQTVPAMLKESRKPETLKKYNLLRGGWKTQKLSTMIVAMSVGDPGDGSVTEFTLGADHGCSSPDAGTVNCHFPFDSSNNLTVGSRVSYTATEGSYAKITITPKLGGLLGAMVSSLLKPIEMEVPLCGANAIMKVGTEETKVNFGECGYFAYRMVAPPFEMFLPDLAGISTAQGPGAKAIPMMPVTLGDFPPLGVEVDTVMQHANGTKMGQSSMVVALDYQ
mmetsp:Transcript_173931/g.423044  ORF Transcript_173931/g.423044 Transcript_173931/m.423044 type:complete len:539 (-) Transcript_173931:111-1727(-)